MSLKWFIWFTPAILLLAGCSSQVHTAGHVHTYSRVGYYDSYFDPFYDCYPSAIWYPYYSMYWNSFADPYCYGYYSGPVYTWSYYHRYPWYRYGSPHYRNPYLSGDHRDRNTKRYNREDKRRDDGSERPILRPPTAPPTGRQGIAPTRSSRTSPPAIAGQAPINSRNQRVRPQPVSNSGSERRTAQPSSAPPPRPPSPPPQQETRSSQSYSPPVASTRSSSSSNSYSQSRSSSQRSSSSGSSRSSSRNDRSSRLDSRN